MSLTETLAFSLRATSLIAWRAGQQRVDLQIDGEIEVRHRLLGLEHAPAMTLRIAVWGMR
jgi:hypothetical protein